MRKTELIVFLLMLVQLPLTAQEQKGFVRTAGRPDAPGTPLKEVMVRMKGARNPVLSDGDGNFTLLIPGAGEGDAIVLSSVVKSGYMLTDESFLERAHVFSSRVPLEIVMMPVADYLESKAAIESVARANAEKRCEQQLALLHEQLERSELSAEEYQRKIDELMSRMDAFDSLLEPMADRYARVDYDKLDSLDAAINRCIVEGELMKAESLINTKGDIRERVSDNLSEGRHLAETEQKLKELYLIVDKRAADDSHETESVVRDCYSRYKIALASGDDESAKMWLDKAREVSEAVLKRLIENDRKQAYEK